MIRYISRLLVFHETPGGQILAIRKGDGQSCYIDQTDFEILSFLEKPADYNELSRQLIKEAGWDSYGLSELPDLLKSLFASNLIVDVDAELEKIKESVTEKEPKPIEVLAFPTRDRPDTMEKALRSWLKKIKESSITPDLIIADDSESENSHQLCITVKSLSRSYSGSIYYVSRKDKNCIADYFNENLKQSVRFALGADKQFESINLAYGSNQNLLMLLCTGKIIGMSDDDAFPDFICRCNYSPGIILESDSRAFDILPLPPAPHPEQHWKGDVFYFHNTLIGTDISFLIAKNHPVFSQNISSRDLHKFSNSETRVRAASFGSWGDAAMDSFIYYLQDRNKLGSEFSTSAEYELIKNSRDLFRCNNYLSIGGREFIGMHTLYDLTDILPPFSPYAREVDSQWSALLEILHPESVIAHPPLAIHHLPEKERKAKTIQEGPLKTGLNNSLQLICRYIAQTTLVHITYKQMGEILMSFSRSDDLPSITAYITARSYTEIQNRLIEQLEYYDFLPENWTDDVNKMILSLQKAMETDQFWLPKQFNKSVKEFRNYLYSYGKLIQEWPEIMFFMKENRDEILENFKQ